MEHPAGESDDGSLRVDFDRRLKLEFHGSRITSDAGLLAFRELDDALGLTDLAGAALSECRRGKNTRHLLTGLFRQSVFGRLAGYEDVNDADRLAHDPAMRAVVDRQGLDRAAASTSQMGRFETEWLTGEANLAALTDLSGAWIDRVHASKPQTTIVLDMDSSVSETHGAQEGSAYNGHFGCTCYHPLFVFNQFGDLERCALRAGNVHSADGWREVLEPVLARYRSKMKRRYFRGDAVVRQPRGLRIACCADWSSTTPPSTPVGSTWSRSRSACCAASVWIAASANVTAWSTRSPPGSASATPRVPGSNGCSPPSAHAAKWPTPIPYLPKNRNQCAEVLRSVTKMRNRRLSGESRLTAFLSDMRLRQRVRATRAPLCAH